MRVQQNSARLGDVTPTPAPIFSNAAAGCAGPYGPAGSSDGGTVPPGIGLTMTNDKPPRIVYAKPPRRVRKKPPAKAAIPSVIVTAKTPSKVAAERRYARFLIKQDAEEP
jgi:hypothetical protein